MGIAVAMMLESGYTNQINTFSLRDVLQKLLDNFPQIEPYRDAIKGKKRGHLFERLRENKYDFETVFKDVLAGGILVTDLSGSDTFRFAHKSYLEYLVSDFYVNFILQDEEREYDFKIANAIHKTLKFKNAQIEESIDVNNFIVQLITNRIRLKVPVEGNEEAYSKAVFHKLISSWWGRRFPNLVFWLRIHPNLLRLHFLTISIGLLVVLACLLDNVVLSCIMSLTFILWVLTLIFSGLIKKNERVKITLTQHSWGLKKWNSVMSNMNIENVKPELSANVKCLLSMDFGNFKELYLSITWLQITSFNLFIIGITFFLVSNIMVGNNEVITSTYAVKIIVYTYMIAYVTLSAWLFRVLMGNFMLYGETINIKNKNEYRYLDAALIGFSSMIFPLVIAIVRHSLPEGILVDIFIFLIIIILLLGMNTDNFLELRKSIKAEQTRQAEAEQPDA